MGADWEFVADVYFLSFIDNLHLNFMNSVLFSDHLDFYLFSSCFSVCRSMNQLVKPPCIQIFLVRYIPNFGHESENIFKT